MSGAASRVRIPLTDSVLIALARLVDDSQIDGYREPSHSAIQAQIDRAGLAKADPNRNHPEKPLGKEKRVRTVLSWAIEHAPEKGEHLARLLLDQIRGLGGFREGSSNYVGREPIENLASVLRSEGLVLTPAGDVHALLLDSLEGTELTEALHAYVRRAKSGAQDAALVTGTGKDLLEATAAHIIQEIWGSYSTRDNFPTLLGTAFAALQLKTSQDAEKPGEPPQSKMERGLFDLACGVNRLRNKQGTGHGRPFLPTIKPHQAKAAIEAMGVVAEYLLGSLEDSRSGSS